jgi:molybdopterin converting factor small subunit
MDATSGTGDDGKIEREERRVQLTVRLFALARQRAGRAVVTLDVPEPATVAALKRTLADACPELAPLVPQLMIAVDADYAGDDATPIPPGADVAAIPPVSGGRPRSGDAPATIHVRCRSRLAP